jgi:hypothetical protein
MIRMELPASPRHGAVNASAARAAAFAPEHRLSNNLRQVKARPIQGICQPPPTFVRVTDTAVDVLSRAGSSPRRIESHDGGHPGELTLVIASAGTRLPLALQSPAANLRG